METSNRVLYVLQLDNDSFYIGQTIRIKKRLKEHFSGKGSSWTRLHKPVRLIETKKVTGLNYEETEILENVLTLNYMEKYGWDKVRGGFFSDCDPIIIKKKLLKFKKDVPNKVLKSLSKSYTKNEDSKFLYCIKLENDRYFLGISKKPQKLFKRYCNEEKAASYIKIHRADKLLFFEKIDYEDSLQLKSILMSYVVKLMLIVGCYKVRGGIFNVPDDYEAYKLFKRIIKNMLEEVPRYWLEYSYEDFMYDTGHEVSSFKELKLNYNKIND